MPNKPWFQANIHAPGTGFALLVIAFCMLIQNNPSAIGSTPGQMPLFLLKLLVQLYH
jgi:hypothetical protein